MSSTSPARSLDSGNHEREATEMGEYENLPRGSGINASSTRDIRASNGPYHETHFSSFRKSTKAFWHRQVAATVPHDACRDHFGTSSSYTHFESL